MCRRGFVGGGGGVCRRGFVAGGGSVIFVEWTVFALYCQVGSGSAVFAGRPFFAIDVAMDVHRPLTYPRPRLLIVVHHWHVVILHQFVKALVTTGFIVTIAVITTSSTAFDANDPFFR